MTTTRRIIDITANLVPGFEAAETSEAKNIAYEILEYDHIPDSGDAITAADRVVEALIKAGWRPTVEAPARGGLIAPHVSEETRAAIQEQLRDCILPQSWADTVKAEHDAHHNRIRDALDATTYPDRPDPATYPYWTGHDGEAAEHHGEPNADDPTDAEVRAAARVVTTVEEAEALQDGTLIVDRDGDGGQVCDHHVRYPANDIVSASAAINRYGPFTVLWEPEEDE